MLDTALDRDRVELLFDRVDHAQALDLVSILDLASEHFGSWVESDSTSRELLRERAVVELADDPRPQTPRLEPRAQPMSDGRVLAGHQERRAVEAGRERRVDRRPQRRRREDADPRCAERMAERLDADRRNGSGTGSNAWQAQAASE